MSRKSRVLPPSSFRRFNSSPEVIRLVVMMYIRFPLSLRNVEDLLYDRGIDICHATVRMWWNRFGPMFAGDIRRQRVSAMRGFQQWRWHLDETYVKLNGEMVYLWRAVSRRRDPRKLRYQDQGQGGSAHFHEEGAQTAWFAGSDHH
jgi:putative transposase